MIAAGLFISLDGVIEAPHEWHFPYFDDDMGAAVGAQMAEAEAMLLGRNTYEEFASYWPNADPNDDITKQMNGGPKIVVSSTLESADWENTTLLRDLDSLRAYAEGKNLGITGSATLVRSLLHAGMLDELRLLIHPIVVGAGKQLFPDGTGKIPLRLTSSTTFGSGVIYATYKAAE